MQSSPPLYLPPSLPAGLTLCLSLCHPVTDTVVKGEYPNPPASLWTLSILFRRWPLEFIGYVIGCWQEVGFSEHYLSSRCGARAACGWQNHLHAAVWTDWKRRVEWTATANTAWCVGFGSRQVGLKTLTQHVKLRRERWSSSASFLRSLNPPDSPTVSFPKACTALMM